MNSESEFTNQLVSAPLNVVIYIKPSLRANERCSVFNQPFIDVVNNLSFTHLETRNSSIEMRDRKSVV